MRADAIALIRWVLRQRDAPGMADRDAAVLARYLVRVLYDTRHMLRRNCAHANGEDNNDDVPEANADEDVGEEEAPGSFNSVLLQCACAN